MFSDLFSMAFHFSQTSQIPTTLLIRKIASHERYSLRIDCSKLDLLVYGKPGGEGRGRTGSLA